MIASFTGSGFRSRLSAFAARTVATSIVLQILTMKQNAPLAAEYGPPLQWLRQKQLDEFPAVVEVDRAVHDCDKRDHEQNNVCQTEQRPGIPAGETKQSLGCEENETGVTQQPPAWEACCQSCGGAEQGQAS